MQMKEWIENRTDIKKINEIRSLIIASFNYLIVEYSSFLYN